MRFFNSALLASLSTPFKRTLYVNVDVLDEPFAFVVAGFALRVEVLNLPASCLSIIQTGRRIVPLLVFVDEPLELRRSAQVGASAPVKSRTKIYINRESSRLAIRCRYSSASSIGPFP